MANSVHLDEIVFEDRNKSYGAYAIRKTYDRNLITAIASAIALVLVFVAMPTIAKLLNGTEKFVPVVKPKPPTTLGPPPSIDKTLPPPPKVYVTPPTVKMIPFMKPEITDEVVLDKDEMKPMDEVLASNPGTESIDGEVPNFDGPTLSTVIVEEEKKDIIFVTVEQMPEFQGGLEKLMNFLGKNMKYPNMAIKLGVEGTVFVGFVVSKEGHIDEVAIVKGISKECDEEAMRVVKLMPNWNAGKQNGKAVAVRFVLPIRFKLAE